MKKSSPFYQTRQIFNCVLFLKNSLKIKLQALIILFAHLLNPYSIIIYITHHIDSLSTFTIPSLYEVNDLLMQSHCTSPTDPLPLSLYHKLSPLFSPIFLDIISNSLNSGQVSPCLKTAIISPILKKTKPRPKLI